MTDRQPFADQFAEFRSSQPEEREDEVLGAFARQLFAQQAFAAAAWYAGRAVAARDRAGGASIDDLILAADYCHAAADHRSALQFTGRLVKARPDHCAFVRRHGLDHMLDGRVDEAERWFLRALELDGEDPVTCDALAHLYGLRSDARKVGFFGSKALRLKDAEASARDA